MAESDKKPSPTAARVQALFPPDEAARFDAYCRLKGFKKSTLITRLVREYLDSERFMTAKTRQP